MSEELQLGDRVTRDGYPSVGTVVELGGDAVGVVVVQWDEHGGQSMRTGELTLNLHKL